MWMCLASYEVLSTLQTAGTICTSTVDRNLSVLEGEKWYFFNAVRQHFFVSESLPLPNMQEAFASEDVYHWYLSTLSKVALEYASLSQLD